MKSRFFALLLAATVTAVPAAAWALPITKSVTVKVYTICDNAGANCAAQGTATDLFFGTAANKIWAQAGIQVVYQNMGKINNGNYLNIDDNVFAKSFNSLALGYDYQSTSVVDMFLTHTVLGNYGEGWFGAGGLVLAMDDILGFSANGRMDTMAHELGHNFGLDPVGDPEYRASDPGHSNNPNELIASGSIRHIPPTLGDINPDGLGYDQISAFQVQVARNSSLLTDVRVTTPEPSSLALVAAGIAALFGAARRRNSRLA